MVIVSELADVVVIPRFTTREDSTGTEVGRFPPGGRDDAATPSRVGRFPPGGRDRCRGPIAGPNAARMAAASRKRRFLQIVIANQYLAGSENYQTFQVGLLALSSDSKAMIAPDSSHGGQG